MDGSAFRLSRLRDSAWFPQAFPDTFRWVAVYYTIFRGAHAAADFGIIFRIMKITDDILYVGVNDHDVDLFEGQFEVPLGMAYNSYVVKAQKVAVMDTVDVRFGDEWLKNVAAATDRVDYLVVQHMEPDHSANIARFAEAYPDAKIVSSMPAFAMMKNYFGTDFADRRVVVKEGDTLDLGGRSLAFVGAPMVHWPEVIVTWDAATGTLFSADGFGKFGAQVQALLKKAAGLPIARICPLHGPVLQTPEEIAHVVKQYQTWSSYGVETEGVCVAYTSVYGHTKAVVEKFCEILKAKGCPKVACADLARDDMYETIEDGFRYGRLVLATTTYNTGVFPKMEEYIRHLLRRNYQNRRVGLIENGTWGPMAAKGMKDLLSAAKGLTFCGTTVTVKGSMTDDTVAQLEKLADEILA